MSRTARFAAAWMSLAVDSIGRVMYMRSRSSVIGLRNASFANWRRKTFNLSDRFSSVSFVLAKSSMRVET